MNIKGNIKYIVTGSVIFLAIYMFVAAIPIGPDVSFTPVWTRDISTAPALPVLGENAKNAATPESLKKPGLEAFVLGDRLGYFLPDGTIVGSTRTDERISASSSAWAIYPGDARNTSVHNPDGSLRMTVPGSGYVHVDGDRTYLFIPGGCAVSQFGPDGKPLWTREHTAPITAFHSSPAGTVIGYADGLIACVRSDGTEAFSFYPGGSNYEIILGAAISEDGSLIACVSGIERQRFILISVKDGQYKIVYHAWLEGNVREQAFVDFEKNSAFAFFQTAKGLGILDVKKRSVAFVPIAGRIHAVGECPGDSLFVALSESEGSYTLSAIERPNHLIAKTTFRAKDAFLIQREKAVFLGLDQTISRIDIKGVK
ncbi:MAG TPA: hypothetical protein PK542_02435 [Treponemataceae bacterium]|nr:hypothetical protein [Treponemataceae bacterium]HPS43327.1 hypothetical protein [Treponemataceae bacterium]